MGMSAANESTTRPGPPDVNAPTTRPGPPDVNAPTTRPGPPDVIAAAITGIAAMAAKAGADKDRAQAEAFTTQVPFADARCGITSLFQNFSDCDFVRAHADLRSRKEDVRDR